MAIEYTSVIFFYLYSLQNISFNIALHFVCPLSNLYVQVYSCGLPQRKQVFSESPRYCSDSTAQVTIAVRG